MSELKLIFTILKDGFTIHRFPSDYKIPKKIFESSFYSITKTENELSIVCSSSTVLNSEKFEPGWSCIKVIGPLDFSLTGILADISTVLAKAGISIFAISTYNTDYILVKREKLQLAKEALMKEEHIFE
jgi:hypothetical protein